MRLLLLEHISLSLHESSLRFSINEHAVRINGGNGVKDGEEYLEMFLSF
jgi:hypothetical protein